MQNNNNYPSTQAELFSYLGCTPEQIKQINMIKVDPTRPNWKALKGEATLVILNEAQREQMQALRAARGFSK